MQIETAIGNAMKRAGMDVAESRLRILATEAMRKHHNNVERAITTFEKAVGGDKELIRAALKAYLNEMPVGGQIVYETQCTVAADRLPNGESGQMVLVDQHMNAAPSPTLADGDGHASTATQASHAQPVREPSQAQIAADIAVRTKSALTVFERELTHTGRMWGNVTYRELDSMMEDGDLARLVKAHIGHLRGEERHKAIRDLMTPREFLGVIRKLRGSDAA